MANISELSVLIKANTKQASQQMKGFGQSMGSVFSKMKVGIMAVGVAVTGFAIASVKQFVEVGDMLGKMSARTGIAVEQLDDLRIAFDLSGTSINGFERGMRTLIMRVDDANNGVTDYVNAFARIGIGVKDLQGLKPDEVFMLVAKGIAGLTTEMDKQQVAIDLLGGKFGTSLLPALANGEAGFRDLLKEAGAMSTWTAEESKLAEDLADDMTELATQSDELKKALAVGIVPALIDTVTWMNNLAGGGKKAELSFRKMSMALSHFLASGVGLQKQSDWYYNKFWPILETTTEKTERLMDINNKLYKFFEKEGIVSTNKLTDTFINLTQRGLDLTQIMIEELTTTFIKLPKVFSDIDDATDFLNDAMKKNKGVVEELEESVISATKSWIDYHMAIGMFQPISDAVGGGGSIESRMPSMMGGQGQMEYLKGVMGLGYTKEEALNWIATKGAFTGAGGGFQVDTGKAINTFTNKAELSAIEKENADLGR